MNDETDKYENLSLGFDKLDDPMMAKKEYNQSPISSHSSMFQHKE